MWGLFITSWPVFYSTCFTVAVISRKGQGGKHRSHHDRDTMEASCLLEHSPYINRAWVCVCNTNMMVLYFPRAPPRQRGQWNHILLCGSTLCFKWWLAIQNTAGLLQLIHKKQSIESLMKFTFLNRYFSISNFCVRNDLPENIRFTPPLTASRAIAQYYLSV